MTQTSGETVFDPADEAGQIEVLEGMARRLIAGTFSAAFTLDAEGQAQMVEALYAQIGRKAADIIRARAQAKAQ
ncbi:MULTISPECIES: hypothetical protein [Streptomyces]|uniref:Uncharacterized protein n=1 Tax=Streptomyces zinciresistens K42 TaxID=700597 RepID=G2G643_9ACTN|nr:MULTISPECIES: hypothetical protein [Streptomyces]EGX61132.1 hypothetical protein SZN_04746 [Streptomyces zinciresistens K42]MDT9696654.1 hypothetical protein [Streptomyces sp. P17]